MGRVRARRKQAGFSNETGSVLPRDLYAIASALDRVRSGDAEALRIFGDRMEVGLKQRLGSQPTPMHSLVQTVVLAKGA